MKPLRMNKITMDVIGPLGEKMESHYIKNDEGLAIIGKKKKSNKKIKTKTKSKIKKKFINK